MEVGCGPKVVFQNTDTWSNKTLRHLAVSGCRVSNFFSLLQTFPNLLQLQLNLAEALASANDPSIAHSSLSRIQVTVNNVVADLECLLRSASNVKRLRLRGELRSNNSVAQFQRIADLFIRLAPHLVKFDCQLFCYILRRKGKESVIRRIHPLFENVRYLVGPGGDRCYATDLEVYPDRNEYRRKYERNDRCVRKTFRELVGSPPPFDPARAPPWEHFSSDDDDDWRNDQD